MKNEMMDQKQNHISWAKNYENWQTKAFIKQHYSCKLAKLNQIVFNQFINIPDTVFNKYYLNNDTVIQNTFSKPVWRSEIFESLQF